MKFLAVLFIVFSGAANACDIYSDGSKKSLAGYVDANGIVFHGSSPGSKWGSLKNNEVICDACEAKTMGNVVGDIYNQYYHDVKNYAHFQSNEVHSQDDRFLGASQNCTSAEALAGVLVLLVYTE